MRVAVSLALAALLSTTAMAQGTRDYPPPSAGAYQDGAQPGGVDNAREEKRERRSARREKLAAMTPAQRNQYEQRKAAKRQKLAAMTPQQRDAYHQRREERREAKEEAGPPSR